MKTFIGINDANDNPIFENDLISQINFNGSIKKDILRGNEYCGEYEAIYQVVRDSDGEFALKMLKGNQKAMESDGLSDFSLDESGLKLRKGKIIVSMSSIISR